MSISEIESKVRELRQLQALIEEAQGEAEAIRDAIKAVMGSSEELHDGEYQITWKAVTPLLQAAPCAVLLRGRLPRPSGCNTFWPPGSLRHCWADRSCIPPF